MARISLIRALLTKGHKSARAVDETCPRLVPVALLSGGSGEALTRPSADIALPPSYPLRQRVQDHISEAATIRENPQVWWWGEQLVVAWLDGVFDLQACEFLERFSSGQF